MVRYPILLVTALEQTAPGISSTVRLSRSTVAGQNRSALLIRPKQNGIVQIGPIKEVRIEFWKRLQSQQNTASESYRVRPNAESRDCHVRTKQVHSLLNALRPDIDLNSCVARRERATIQEEYK